MLSEAHVGSKLADCPLLHLLHFSQRTAINCGLPSIFRYRNGGKSFRVFPPQGVSHPIIRDTSMWPLV